MDDDEIKRLEQMAFAYPYVQLPENALRAYLRRYDRERWREALKDKQKPRH